MAKDTLTLHKKKAWHEFSIFIRTRDCILTTGELDGGACVTCLKWFPFKKLQAGHWIPGRNNAVLFSEEGTHAQCMQCNVHKKSNPIEYWKFMERTYGRKRMEQLIAESKATVIYKAYNYDAIAEKYKALTKRLIEEGDLNAYWI